MTLKFQIAVLFFILLIGVPFFVYRSYQNSKPKYVPPKPREEITITIIPGWNLRDVALYLVEKGFASSTKDVYSLTGKPAVAPVANSFERTNFEGFISPETYRVYKDAKLDEVVKKLMDQRTKELAKLKPTQNGEDWWPVLTMASLLEKEGRTLEDRRIIADILYRRLDRGWALQLDSTVHYVVDRTGDVFTTKNERSVDSPWNTYKYPGLPLGPICNPSVQSIEAALNPEKNSYWYFLTGNDGKMYYAKTLEEHNLNRYKHL